MSLKVHNCVYNCLSPVPRWSQINPIQEITFYEMTQKFKTLAIPRIVTRAVREPAHNNFVDTLKNGKAGHPCAAYVQTDLMFALRV